MRDTAVREDPCKLEFVPHHLKTQRMCNEAATNNPYTLRYVPDCFKNQEMYDTTMHINPAAFFLIPERFEPQEMCIEGVEVTPWQLDDVPDYFKGREMCDKAVREEPSCLQYVPDWFVAQQLIELWDNVNDYCNDDEIIEWYDSYKKCKTQKAQIKEGFCPLLAIHHAGEIGACQKTRKNRQKKCGSNMLMWRGEGIR